MLTVVVYNFSWSITSTAQQIDNFELVSQSSWWSVLAGAILIFGFTSSVYHLFLLSLLRLYAVKFPIKYKFLTHRAVLYSLMLVWLAAVIASTLPSKLLNFKMSNFHYSCISIMVNNLFLKNPNALQNNFRLVF